MEELNRIKMASLGLKEKRRLTTASDGGELKILAPLNRGEADRALAARLLCRQNAKKRNYTKKTPFLLFMTGGKMKNSKHAPLDNITGSDLSLLKRGVASVDRASCERKLFSRVDLIAYMRAKEAEKEELSGSVLYFHEITCFEKKTATKSKSPLAVSPPPKSASGFSNDVGANKMRRDLLDADMYRIKIIPVHLPIFAPSIEQNQT